MRRSTNRPASRPLTSWRPVPGLPGAQGAELCPHALPASPVRRNPGQSAPGNSRAASASGARSSSQNLPVEAREKTPPIASRTDGLPRHLRSLPWLVSCAITKTTDSPSTRQARKSPDFRGSAVVDVRAAESTGSRRPTARKGLPGTGGRLEPADPAALEPISESPSTSTQPLTG